MNALQEILSAATVVATLGSAHLDTTADVEWFNPGLGAEVRVSDRVYVGAGAYRNSFRDTTTYVGAGVRACRLGPVNVGVEIARAWGYDQYRYIGGLALSFRDEGAKLIINHKIVGVQYRF